LSWVADFVDRAMGRPKPTPPPEDLLPACGGVYFIRTSLARRAPVRIGITDNIGEALRRLQATTHPHLRLVRYERIPDEAARQARVVELYTTFKRLHLTGPRFNASILKHLEGKT
jgi:hypothetical protein